MQKNAGRIFLLLLIMTISLQVQAYSLFNRGLEKRELKVNNLEREYWIHLPAKNKSPVNLPIVFILHGGGGKGYAMAGLTHYRFNELSDRYNFIAVYPQGIDKSWNDGRTDPISGSIKKKIDDLSFFKEMINQLEKDFEADRSRVFATGISNGGIMSFYLACKLQNTFRAIAPVTANIGKEVQGICERKMNTGLILFNGTSDPLVPYNGGQVTVAGKARGAVTSTADSMRIWSINNSCSGKTTEKELPDTKDDQTNITKIEFKNCSFGNSIYHYRINGGGHTWPGGRQYLPKKIIGTVTEEINAADLIWEYFSSFR